MRWLWIIPAVIAALAALHLTVCFIASLHIRRPKSEGDDSRGLAIYVEGIRWMRVHWDYASCEGGMARAGFEGKVQYWRWHSTLRGMLALPVIMCQTKLENRAKRLAELVMQERRKLPHRSIHLIGHSCGAYLVLRALELLGQDGAEACPPGAPDGKWVDSAALLQGAVASDRDLTPALKALAGKLIVTSSLGDFILLGAGTLLFGTADRWHTLSAGLVGLKPPPATNGRVVHIPWRPGMLTTGHLGGHFSTTTFIAQYVAPHMLKTR